MKHDSDAQLAQLIAEFHESWLYQIAEVYAFRGENDRAFEWLDRAFSKRDPGLSAVKIAIAYIRPPMYSLRNSFLLSISRYSSGVRRGIGCVDISP
jgi:hypothetical protein